MHQRIDRYEIVREIGRGGMATVYYARDPRMERDVAIKVLQHDLLSAPQFRERFEREARVIAGLDHLSIVPIYDFGEDEEGDLFIVMRYMAGGSLAERLEREGCLPLAEAAIIADRIASALDRAHAKGIVHRDLQPGNILFDQYGNAFLSDFGIVKMLRAGGRITSTGSFFGTPHYMSPEQVVGDLDLDGRADVYALGVILFEMLSGVTPYAADTALSVAFKHVYEDVPSILDVKPEIAPRINKILKRAMAKVRDDRHPSAGALVADLLEAAGSEIAALAHRTGALTGTAAERERLTPTTPVEGSREAETARPAPPADQRGILRWGWGVGGLLAAGVIALMLSMGGRGGSGSPGGGSGSPERTSGPPTPAWALAATRIPPDLPPVAVASAPQAHGEWIAFISGEKPNYDVYLVRPDGSDLTRLTFTTDDNHGPAWSPDGTRIAFRAQSESGTRVILVMNADRSAVAQLTDATWDSYSPAWSPDGTQIAFVSERDGNPEIYVMRADGTRPIRLTDNEDEDYSPAWSPDGARIAYYSNARGLPDIYSIDAQGDDLRRLTSQRANDYQAAWSPDGERIAFVSERDGNAELYVMRSDGTGQMRITHNTAADMMPHWSPDGERIVFVSRRDGNLELYLVDADGRNEVRLTYNPDDDFEPAWQP